MGKKKEEIYQLTFKGALVCAGLSEQEVQRAIDSIELYMHRSNNNGIVLTKQGLQFVELEKSE